MVGLNLTAIEEFLNQDKKMIENIDTKSNVYEFLNKKEEIIDKTHNSDIIYGRMDEIEGIGQSLEARVVKWFRKTAKESFPILDTALDYFELSVLETILRYFDRKVKEVKVGWEEMVNVATKQPVIFASNHETETEHLYLARACCPTRDLEYFKFFKFLNLKGVAKKRYVPIFFAKYQLFNMPIIGSLFASTAFPIERELKDSKSIELGSEFLQKGNNILIYPEGTRNLHAREKPKSGIIRLAIQNKVPIIPIGHVGLWELTKGQFIPSKEGYWYCEFGKPIYYDKYYDQEVDYTVLRDLTNELMDEIERLKERGRKAIIKLNEDNDEEIYSKGTINDVVIHKFKKMPKVPNNIIDSNYRRFIKRATKIPYIGEKIDSLAHLLIRMSSEFIINPLNFDLQVNGKHHLEVPGVRPAILVSNHESFFDIFTYGLKLAPPDQINYRGYLNRAHRVWFMMKKELAEIPIISSWTLSAGGFPVARGEGDWEAMRVAKELVRRDRSPVIFPQQTTYPEIDVNQAKTGAVRLAIDMKRPIIPISIKGSHDAMKHGILKVFFPPKAFPIEVNIGEPIYYDKYYDTEPSYEVLKELTTELMTKIKYLRENGTEYRPDLPGGDVISPLDRVFKRVGKIFNLPRPMGDLTKTSPIEKTLNKITDSLGISSTEREGEKKKEAGVKLSPIDVQLQKLKKQGEKLGLYPYLDDIFYTTAKRSLDLVLNNLYDFSVHGAENIPVKEDVGVILLSQSGSKLDFVVGSCIIPEKVHFMIDAKTYKTPVVSTLLQSLGFFRQTESETDFEPLLHIKSLLQSKKIVGVFAEGKNRERLIKTYAAIAKMAIEGKPTVIVPMAIVGTETPFPPVKVIANIGKPIGPLTRKHKKREIRYELGEGLYQMINDLKSEAYEMRYTRKFRMF
ncbi:MAG: 1-acyl-sn-glycerol-3-phosphate acyltransferase [Candidatus Lokiarchaeota archaeon]|nr:1-acyl-sn-glycerol-3-phosphate acyltransferase [Candidatus Lokiarchaeota archaeon]